MKNKRKNKIAYMLQHIAAIMERNEKIDRDLKIIGDLLDAAGYEATKRAVKLLQQLENSYDDKVAGKLWDQLKADGLPQTHRLFSLLKQVREEISYIRVQQTEGADDIERKQLAKETHENFKKLVPWLTKMQENLNRIGFSDSAEFVRNTKEQVAELVIKLSKV